MQDEDALFTQDRGGWVGGWAGGSSSLDGLKGNSFSKSALTSLHILINFFFSFPNVFLSD